MKKKFSGFLVSPGAMSAYACLLYTSIALVFVAQVQLVFAVRPFHAAQQLVDLAGENVYSVVFHHIVRAAQDALQPRIAQAAGALAGHLSLIHI